jgi:hypothetical protein
VLIKPLQGLRGCGALPHKGKKVVFCAKKGKKYKYTKGNRKTKVKIK